MHKCFRPIRDYNELLKIQTIFGTAGKAANNTQLITGLNPLLPLRAGY